MQQATYRAIRRRLLARASTLALRVALRRRSWASGLVMVGLIGAPVSALAGETILTTDADVIIRGAAEGDQSGYSVSGAGDVNGDGVDDLIIGTNFAGASYVVFGNAAGLPAIVNLASHADLTILGAAEDRFGFSVSGAGDVNGDGIDDLIVGAPEATPDGPLGAGATYVVLGATDLSGTIDVADPVSGADLTILGAAYDDSSGFSVSGAGDVNGDGVDDLVIGAINASPAGASYVVFGTDRGFPQRIDLATDADLIIRGVAPGDEFGRSVSGAGDINGDGIDDLIIGAPRAPNNLTVVGTSYVVLGATDLSGIIDLADPANGADLTIRGAASDDRFGFSVSGAGDVNGDGIDDLIVGAPYADPEDRSYAGASYVVFGRAQGFPPTIDLATDADLVIQGADTDDGSGVSVSGAGDFNGDGVDDLVIGAPYAAPNGHDGAGSGFVVFGSDRGFPPTIDLATDADLVIQGAAAFDRSGFPVSGAGDVNGDGIDDLIIGAPQATPGGRGGAGASYVVFGGPAAALGRLIAEIEAADLPRRLERRLTRNLDNALASVTDGRLGRAILRLRTFVGRVEAQPGSKIDEAVADDWIATAESISDTLKAQRRQQRKSQRHARSSMAKAP